MSQLILNFEHQVSPDFTKFLGQANRELLQVLQDQQERLIYVWGAEGRGKSHFLKAWVAQAVSQGHSAQYWDAKTKPFALASAQAQYIAIDAIEFLDSTEQQDLFHLFNQIRDGGFGYLLMCANIPPLQLSLREDLRTRMAYALVYELKAINDDEKLAALQDLAQSRQLAISDDLFKFLLLHWRRDMDSLVTMVQQLDDYSLMTGRHITLPLLKKLLEDQNESSHI
ncbi:MULTISPECIES: DnaA regulatory inactivator Hda [Vitreoscilla]|uniref:DnaA regulatory inactivator Hda n=1 Tax=Vitreoscilla stercoraria TaxID=61 RepID=A0ABY4EA90_VITST|nr:MULTISPECIES: DnaA regulatory inactivator Hda [Vitreoscilla]AUZ04434.2 DnaA regulatory inactivator Hda [Vitreoscilla sp. C1]UOO91845.1 DnaA regulatory inactivator Hda [Vitreoscilla stercoraria]